MIVDSSVDLRSVLPRFLRSPETQNNLDAIIQTVLLHNYAAQNVCT